ncbi:MAG TPA: DUF402 domain-containing protein [Acidimicrobiales bacterium]|nr:DUF402 domain-containing protein [Acidimicrobiales bacterium]
MREVWIERRKWPDAPHYGHPGWVLGSDEHGTWLELRKGSPIRRGDEVLFLAQYDGIMCASHRGGWLAWFPEEGPLELYVDIATVPAIDERSVTMVDLDFDVVRHRDGRVELVDEDEFALHRETLGYPEELVRHAEETAAIVLAAVMAGEEPFDGSRADIWRRQRAR